jgi:hypothetical protein
VSSDPPLPGLPLPPASSGVSESESESESGSDVSVSGMGGGRQKDKEVIDSCGSVSTTASDHPGHLGPKDGDCLGAECPLERRSKLTNMLELLKSTNPAPTVQYRCWSG